MCWFILQGCWTWLNFSFSRTVEKCRSHFHLHLHPKITYQDLELGRDWDNLSIVLIPGMRWAIGSTSLWIVTSTFRICKRKSTKPRPLRRKTYGPSSVFLRTKNYPGRHLAVISPRQPIVRLSATIRYPQPQLNCDHRFQSKKLAVHIQINF